MEVSTIFIFADTAFYLRRQNVAQENHIIDREDAKSIARDDPHQEEDQGQIHQPVKWGDLNRTCIHCS